MTPQTILDQYLHRMFLDHDCVVVPGLGGFVCNRRAASYDEQRQELVPPSRSILFNERLVHHDGVLVQAVAHAESITFDEALKRVVEEAESLKRAIAAGKTVNIAHVGRLYTGSNQRVQFLADEEMERMLASFGLRRIPIRPLAPARIVKNAPSKSPSTTKVIHMPLARVAAAIAVPVLGGIGMFMMDSWNGEDALMRPLSVTAVSSEYLPRFEGEAIPAWSDAEALETEESETAVATPEEEPAVIETAAIADQPVGVPAETNEAGLYMLVAGAFSVEANAQTLALSLRENGFDAEVFLQDGGLHIVTFATHVEEDSARAHLELLRTQQISKNAWLKPWKVIR
jgi:hypothetical protein